MLEPRQADSAAPQRREGERSEPDQSGGSADSGGTALATIPDPEVPAKPKRRQFTAEYKPPILDQADACRDKEASCLKLLWPSRLRHDAHTSSQSGITKEYVARLHHDKDGFTQHSRR
jgi:hypothetical protein